MLDRAGRTARSQHSATCGHQYYITDIIGAGSISQVPRLNTLRKTTSGTRLDLGASQTVRSGIEMSERVAIRTSCWFAREVLIDVLESGRQLIEPVLQRPPLGDRDRHLTGCKDARRLSPTQLVGPLTTRFAAVLPWSSSSECGCHFAPAPAARLSLA
jgi:hypothetical protein